MSNVVAIRGPLAQDKDAARSIRVRRLLPALAQQREIRLDFSEVRTATQSFIHALISEPLWRFGARAIQLVEFHGCSPQVRSAIETVVGYSFRAREYAATALPTARAVNSVDVPQADDLRTVRRIVELAADGPIPITLALDGSSFSSRHFSYRANAARVLGLLEIHAGVMMMTDRGRMLVDTLPGGAEEAAVLREAVAGSPVLQRVSRGLLSPKPPSLSELVTRIMRHTSLSHYTAERRAKCLLAWRRQLMDSLQAQQLSLRLPEAARTPRNFRLRQ